MISSMTLIECQAWHNIRVLVFVEDQAWHNIKVLVCTYKRLEGLTGGIKRPDLDGGVLASAEEQLSCLGQT